MSRHAGRTAGWGWWLILMLAAGPAGGQSSTDGLGLETRFHYDWMGHRYRLGESDTLDRYDEKGISALITYGERYHGGAWAENKATVSDRSLRNALAVGWSSAPAEEVRWSIENRVDLKEYRWRGEDLYGSSYLEDDLTLEGSWPLSGDVRLAIRQDLSYVDYQKTTVYFRDAWMSRSGAELLWNPDLMWDVAAAYTLGLKSVPDSSAMNYWTHTISTSVDGSIGWRLRGRLTGFLEQRRDEDRQQGGHSLDLMLEAEMEYDLGIRTGLVMQGELAMLTYDHPDEVYYDNWTAVVKAGLSQDLWENVNLSLLPLLRRSVAQKTSFGETYHEIGAELDVDYYGSGRIWGQVSVEIDYRMYDDSVEETFYSDYFSIRPTVMMNLQLSPRIDLDLLLDHEPEWHRQKEDDFTSSLVSCSLSYRFR